MRRLLEWKQRMLQSPLTRKSSRNASRTQTPTNSNSPVPSLLFQQQQQHQQHHGENNFRQRVLEELERQVIRSRFPFHWVFFLQILLTPRMCGPSPPRASSGAAPTRLLR